MSILIGGSAIMFSVGLKGWSLPFIGFVVGICMQITVGFLQVILGIPTSPVLTLAITMTLPLAIWFWCYQRGYDVKIRLASAALAAIFFILNVILWRTINPVSVTPDSFVYLNTGALIASDNINFALPISLLRRLLAVPLIHAPANLFDEFYLRSVTPLLGISTLIILAWLCLEGLKVAIKDYCIVQLLSISAVFLLATNNRFVFNSFYINGHMLTAVLLLLLIGSGWLLVRGAAVPNSALLIMQIIALPALTVTRPETSIFAGIALFPLVLSERVSLKHRTILLATLGISIAGWYGFLWMKFMMLGDNVPNLVVGMFGLGLIAIMAVFILRIRQIQKIQQPILIFTEAGLWLLLIVFAFRNPSPLYVSIGATIENVIYDAGGWGVSLLILGIIFCGVLILTQAPDRIYLRFPLTSYIPFVFLLVYIREGAYRVGHGDSFNRMIFHIVPLAILFIISAVSSDRWGLPERLKIIWSKLIEYVHTLCSKKF